MYKEAISSLIENCRRAAGDISDHNEVRRRILPERIDTLLSVMPAKDFLDWVRGDREFSYYYYDAQQSGVCAKPVEAAALILEQIVLDALE